MIINKLQVTLYSDLKSDTITAYVKFNRMADQIFLGFRNVSKGIDSPRSLTCKSKKTKAHISGVHAELIIPHMDYPSWTFNLMIDGVVEPFVVSLVKTNQTPIVATGIWEKSISFNQWMSNGFEESAFLQKSKLHTMLEDFSKDAAN